MSPESVPPSHVAITNAPQGAALAYSGLRLRDAQGLHASDWWVRKEWRLGREVGLFDQGIRSNVTPARLPLQSNICLLPDLRYHFSPHACQQVFRQGRAVYSIDAVNITAMSLRIKFFVRIYTKHVNHHVICSKHMDRSIEKCFCVGFASFNLAKRGQPPLRPLALTQ